MERKRKKREVIDSREKLPTNELIIDAIYSDGKGGMFYVTSAPVEVPGEKGWYYYDVRSLED